MSIEEHIKQLNLRPPSSTDQVFKDDCAYCFDTPESEHGLDVCLTCFSASSPAPDRNYTKLHYSITKHPLYLNIKKIPIERERSPPKMARLAIEAEKEEDRFKTVTKVKDLEFEGQAVPEDLVSSLVKGVLNATSYAKREEIQAWELEIQPCEHILTLQQDPASKILPAKLKSCAQCDLTENLWLCLVCGNIGCGREQFGGVGGNSHGIAHYESTGHAVSIKLGSISPEGTADVFCYKCNDEVQDPNLGDHLAHWGINIAKAEKTEKSLTELQLEQNQKWDFSMSTEDGKSLEPVFGPGLTGLKNLGNSCYISSVIQCLFDIPQFRQLYSSTNFPAVSDPANNLYIQLEKMADGLFSGRYSVPDYSTSDAIKYQKGIAPGMLKALIGRGHEEFSTMRQQDAFEFLGYLLSKLSSYARSHDLSDPNDLFKFNTERRIECTNCHKVRYRVEDDENLSIPVPIRELGEGKYETIELKELFDTFSAQDTVDYTCPSCKTRGSALVSVGFKSFPDVLILNARRFNIQNWVPVKLDIPVAVDEEPFTLDKYRSKHGDNEDVVEDDEEEEAPAFVPNDMALAQLEAMGFPRTRCEKALFNTGNSDSEAAMEWLFQHMEDPDIDEPMTFTKSTDDSAAIAQLGDMGFTPGQARTALKHTGGNVEQAVEWLFTNPDVGEEPEVGTDSPKKVWGSETLPPKYRLKSIICHKGGSIHAGHYVAFIRKIINGKEQWVLFNDEKVVVGGEAQEMKQFAYVYFFERLD